MTGPQADTATDPQRVIVELRQQLEAQRAEGEAAMAREAALAEALAARNVELAERIAELAGRKGQFDERIEHQSATIDVLKAMSASPSDTQPVFDLIVRRAMQLCDASIVSLHEFDGELMHFRAWDGVDPMPASYAAQFPIQPSRSSVSCRAIIDRQIVHARDLDADAGVGPAMRAYGHKSQVSVPLMKSGAAIGVISLGAAKPGGFSDSQIELLKTFAEQAVIAITSAETYRALQERTAALAQRNSEYGERIDQQSATIDVLKAMSASPDDPQPAFDLIVRRAVELCDGKLAALYEYDGALVHMRCYHGHRPTAAATSNYAALFPMKPTRGSIMCRAILDRQTIHITDYQADTNLLPAVKALGHQSQLTIPLMREGTAIGAISLTGKRGGFTDSQIALLQTFAEQAVIAITSVETYRALQTRTSALQEALEYQTATSDVLNVISRSTFDLQPVLETVVQTSARLCNADRAAIFRREGDLWCLAANFGFPHAWEDYMRVQGAFSLDRLSEHAAVRAAVERRPVHIDDLAAVPGYETRLGEQRTTLGVPLLREGEAIGTIVLARLRVEPFTNRQIELVNTFADQAVIAIENTRLITEQREALEQQTATAEVLQVINASPGNLAPVFDAILEKAHSLIGGVIGALVLYEGPQFRAVATHGFSEQHDAMVRQLHGPTPGHRELLAGARFKHYHDLRSIEDDQHDAVTRSHVENNNARTALWVPLRRDERLLGLISVYRLEVRPFLEKEIALLENFAAQAVIAMENARLLTETRDALEQQTATAEVLQVINASPGNLTPVFEAILEKAHNLCDVAVGSLSIYLNGFVHTAATRGFSEEYQVLLRRPYPAIGSHQMLMRGGPSRQTPDFRTVPVRPEMASSLDNFERMKLRTGLWVPLRKDGTALGCISSYRDKVQPFSEKEIALLENFAAQAVIAMENARLLNEIRQRQEELRITFENMGDGVALFDDTRHLVASNRRFQDMLDVPDDVISARPAFADYIRYLADRGEYGADAEDHVQRLLAFGGQPTVFERTRPNGRIIEIRGNPVPGGGFVVIYSDITDRKNNEEALRAARDAAEEASRTIEAAYRDLKAAQANLIQAEKMASLGQLTAGIAHEIKNPLNFVNNFAALSVDLLAELKDTAAPGFAALTEQQRAEIDDVSAMLTSNLEKITEHGKRADGIVKAMLEHSRGSSGERRMVDLNALIDDALNLAYHGARAQDQNFNITLERDFAEGIAPIEVNPQDMTRVFLNTFSNGFYATTRRARDGGDVGFVPTLKVTTIDAGEAVEIRVRDNGIGIPADIRDKLFQPFFTTKPTGEGTGLGLSITYDIVTQQHGGSIAVDSKVGEYSEFTIRLPR